MTLIFFIGWGSETMDDRGPAKRKICSSCNTEQLLHLYEKNEWLTLFFVNVISYDAVYYLACKNCSKGERISKLEFDELSKIRDK